MLPTVAGALTMRWCNRCAKSAAIKVSHPRANQHNTTHATHTWLLQMAMFAWFGASTSYPKRVWKSGLARLKAVQKAFCSTEADKQTITPRACIACHHFYVP